MNKKKSKPFVTLCLFMVRRDGVYCLELASNCSLLNQGDFLSFFREKFPYKQAFCICLRLQLITFYNKYKK